MSNFATDPNITMQGLRPPENPMDIYSRFAQLKNMGQQSQLHAQAIQEGQMQLDEAKAAKKDQDTLQQLYMQNQGDLSKVADMAPAAGVRPQSVLKLKDAVRKDEEERRKLDAAGLDNAKKKAELIGSASGAILNLSPEQRPQAVTQAIQGLAQQGVLSPQEAQQYGQLAQAPPDQLEQALKIHQMAAVNATAQYEKEQQSRQPTNTEKDFQSFYAPWLAAKGLQKSAVNEMAARNEFKNQKDSTLTETDKYIRDWLATRKLADTPENRQQARAAYIKETKTDPALVRVEGFAETRGMSVTDKKTGVTAPMSWADYNKLSKQFPGRYTAPQFDPETQTNILAWRDLAKGKTKDQVTSYDTFLRHTGDLYDSIGTLQNTNSPLLNKPLNWLRNNTGQPQVRAFLAKLDPVLKEFESFLLNNRALYSEDREDAKRIIDENASPAQMLAVLPSLAHTGDARLQALNESFKRATGEDIPSLYSAPAQAVLQKLRVKTQDGAGGGGITVTDPQGGVHTFPDQAAADKFKKLAGIQ